MRYLFLLLIFILPACASNSSYDDNMQQYVGMSELSLQESWGMPNNMFYVTPNEKVVSYLKIDNGPIDGDTTPYSDEVAYGPISSPDFGNPQHNTYYCETSFTIINGQVSSYTFNGDDCVSGD